MGIRDQMRRLKREVHKDTVVVRLKDGGTRVFAEMDVLTQMFLAQYGLILGEPRPSEVLDAVRRATPESREAFEAEYGSIEMGATIIASEDEGGWVEVHRLLRTTPSRPSDTRVAPRMPRRYGARRGRGGRGADSRSTASRMAPEGQRR